jgi:hypothetical protein
MEWLDYFARIGRVDPVRLYDRGPALLAWKIDSVMGGKSEMKDYLPHYKEEDIDVPVAEAIRLFGGEVKRG